MTLQRGLRGAKPPRFCRWVLDLLGYLDGDTVDDLFPGTNMSDPWTVVVPAAASAQYAHRGHVTRAEALAEAGRHARAEITRWQDMLRDLKAGNVRVYHQAGQRTYLVCDSLNGKQLRSHHAQLSCPDCVRPAAMGRAGPA